jgi:threonine synthase
LKKKAIRYYSTNLRSPEVTFREALLKGLAPDGGLYMPGNIPEIPPDELEALSGKNYPEVAADILFKFLIDEIGREELLNICVNAYRFEIPIEKVHDRNYVMRLDQGPTASFKDFAALLMGRLMQYYLKIDDQHITILTATSGDTGGAVANAFYDLENIRVIILFPFREVTDLQRKQMTTLKKNIQVFAIDGKFDDCQKLVKNAFMDPSLSHIRLSSANSINIGRLLPQSVYYFYAWSYLSGKINDKVVFSVPSGNFGNLSGGLIAREMGLPVKRFVISTNENDEVPEFLKTGKYKKISPSKNCISSAMNVGHPSNLARIVALYGGKMDEKGEILQAPDLRKMRKDLFAVSITDVKTKATIESCYKQFGLLLEPHGAVAWQGLKEFFKQNPDPDAENLLCISLETAHPAKFSNEIYRILNFVPSTPVSILSKSDQDEEYVSLDNNYNIFRNYILKNS